MRRLESFRNKFNVKARYKSKMDQGTVQRTVDDQIKWSETRIRILYTEREQRKFLREYVSWKRERERESRVFFNYHARRDILDWKSPLNSKRSQ